MYRPGCLTYLRGLVFLAPHGVVGCESTGIFTSGRAYWGALPLIILLVCLWSEAQIRWLFKPALPAGDSSVLWVSINPQRGDPLRRSSTFSHGNVVPL